MVSTRNHPSNFPPPSTDSPSKAITRTSRPSSSPAPTSPPTKGKPKGKSRQTSKHSFSGWTHTPSNLTLIWLLVSLPLVAWDTGYVLLRPYSMPGGSLHWPLWAPYKLYGEVDYIYGFPALEAGNGFTSAQGVMNIVESLGYAAYLWLVWRFGHATEEVEGRGAPSSATVGWIGAARSVGGAEAGLAVLIAFTTSALTFSKTVLYCTYRRFFPLGRFKIAECTRLMRPIQG